MKTVIFGANKQCVSLLGTDNLLSASSHITLVTPFGVDKDSPTFDYLRAFPPKVDYRITHNIPCPEKEPADTLLLVENKWVKSEVYKQILDSYERTSCRLYLPEALQKRLNVPDSPCVHVLPEFDNYEEDLGDGVFQIGAPVVLITGAGRECNKFELTLGIRDFLAKRGYSSLCLASSPLSQLWSIHNLPKFLFEKRSLTEKVTLFNHFLYMRIRDYKPEVVVICVPGGIIPQNPFRYEEIGEMAMVISTAIPVSVNLCSLYCHSYSDLFLDNLGSLCKYRYGYMPLMYHASNMLFEVNPEYRTIEVSAGSPDRAIQYAEELCHNYHRDDMFSIFDEKTKSECFEKVLAYLTED